MISAGVKIGNRSRFIANRTTTVSTSVRSAAITFSKRTSQFIYQWCLVRKILFLCRPGLNRMKKAGLTV